MNLATWITHFERNRQHRPEPDWDAPIRLSQTQISRLLPSLEQFQLGDGGGPERLWWLLRHFGHDDCAVLLGGIEAWGGELRAGEEEIEPVEFVPRERSGDTIAAGEVVRRLADGVLPHEV